MPRQAKVGKDRQTVNSIDKNKSIRLSSTKRSLYLKGLCCVSFGKIDFCSS